MQQFLSITGALSDESRVRALMLLKNGELCVCQIIEMLNLAPSTVSKHMTILLHAGLVERRKEGRWHYYRLTENNVTPLVQETLDWIEGALKENPTVIGDEMRLKSVVEKDKEALCECYRKGPENGQ
jgi:DNA-binding transcriptional ArsR family regulator